MPFLHRRKIISKDIILYEISRYKYRKYTFTKVNTHIINFSFRPLKNFIYTIETDEQDYWWNTGLLWRVQSVKKNDKNTNCSQTLIPCQSEVRNHRQK